MNLYGKLIKVTFWKVKDTKWIVATTSIIIAMVTILMMSSSSIEESYKKAMQNPSITEDFSIARLKEEEAKQYGSSEFWQGSVEKVGVMSGVVEMSVEDTQFYFELAGMSPEVAQTFYNIHLSEGNWPRGDQEIVVEKRFVENEKKYHIGSQISLYGFHVEGNKKIYKNYTIVGVMESKNSSGIACAGLLSLEDAKEIIEETGKIPFYRMVGITPDSTVSSVEHALTYVEMEHAKQVNINDNKIAIADEEEEASIGVFRGIAIFVALVSGALLFNMLQISMNGRTSQIGMLRCIGLNRK